jgi:hypothetical protein
MDRDPRLSRFGNERVEELAEERVAVEEDDHAFTALVATVTLAFVATPPGWVAIIAVATGRGYFEAVEWLVLSISTLAFKYAPVFAVFVVGWIVAVWAISRPATHNRS